jgi:uncharacterized protein YcsI (UPF0317 family)/DUF971 family protein
MQAALTPALSQREREARARRSVTENMIETRELTSAAELRRAIRAGRHTGPTAGRAAGFVQANVVILPLAVAGEFAEFCRLNGRPCPLVDQTEPGDPEPKRSAPGADLRTDVPRYRVFRQGVAEAVEPTEVRSLWRDDLVGFLLGCSFTFERALAEAGLPVRHVELGRNVPMFRTSLACRPAGRFAGPLVVSMRPYRPDQVEWVREITGRYPTMHGEPVHVGDPQKLGIVDITRPDFGDPVPIEAGEVPVFWACGVTPQLALEAAKPELAITHSPGCMFVTDLREGPDRLMAPRPTNLALEGSTRLLIEWSDGQRRSYEFGELRNHCPCATCREKRSQPPPPSTSLTILSAAETQPLKLVDMSPVGNYAYTIKFSDGHDTGIYTFDLLRELGREEK